MSTYVKKQDYYDYSGIDLDIELKKSNYDNPTKAVDIFIDKIENFCLDYLVTKYRLVVADLTDAQKEKLNAGILRQMDYIRINGDLTTYNPNNLPVLSLDAFNQLDRKSVV